jgi:hypothetical protein
VATVGQVTREFFKKKKFKRLEQRIDKSKEFVEPFASSISRTAMNELFEEL